MRFSACLLVLLLLTTGDMRPDPLAPALPVGCHRFFSLVPEPPASILPETTDEAAELHSGSLRPLAYAAHTLFLDESVAKMAADIGFDTIVQVFPWRDLNPAPGVFSWDTADTMVQAAASQHLSLVVRLDMPPQWARYPDVQPSLATGTLAGRGSSLLPFDLEAYVRFVSAVAHRYRGRIDGYIIWNEPNLAAEWSRSGDELESHWLSYSGWVADPIDYVGLLGVAYRSIKLADPQARVITAGLAPTNENSPRAMDDRPFLQQMLAAGAARCFDVLGVHAYGYGLDPDVERETQDGLNLSRILDLRQIMLASGVEKPVWITELGYTLGPGQHPAVTEEQQAKYLEAAIVRTRRDWPWVKMFTVWNLAYGLPDDDEMGGYSLVNPDLTPRLAYERVQQLLAANSS